MRNKIKETYLVMYKMAQSKLNIMALAVYSILSIIFTYPVAFSASSIPGQGDVFWYIWDLWWFKKSILSFSSPYYTSYIYYPTGVSLAFSEVTPFNAILAIPLQSILGLIGTYNLLYISTFILSGYGTFLLVKYLTQDVKAAFIAGLIFMFSPYRFAHGLGHLNLISTEWIPFYILFLIRTLNETKRTNALCAALFLFLNTLCSYYYLIYMVVFTMIYAVYYCFVNQNFAKIIFIKKIFAIFLPFSLAVLPFLYPLLMEIFTSKSDYMYYGGFVDYSADLVGFFIPSLFHPLFRNLVLPIYSNFTSYEAEYIVFAGYTVLFLSAIACIKIKTKEVRFWAASLFIFFILCLGPILHINGIFTKPFEQYNFVIPLPYAVLMHIPIFSIARAPSRWDVLVMMALAVLCGYSLNYIFKNRTLRGTIKENILFVLFSCLILFEFLSIPYPITDTTVPSFYEQISKDPEDYSILEIPDYFFATTYSEYMYYQTIHGKKLINGYVSRAPDSALDFVDSTPFLNQLMYLSHPSMRGDILNQNLTGLGQDILAHYNIRYVILHKELMSDRQFNSANALLKGALKEPPVIYEHNTTRTWNGEPYTVNDTMIVYRVKQKSIISFNPSNEGWHTLEDWSGTSTRWMGENATLLIYSRENRTAKLVLQALAFNQIRTLKIYANDEMIYMRSVPTDFMTINTSVNLKTGANILRFGAPGGCQAPRDINEQKSKDNRCLSFAIQNVTIS